MKIEGKTYTIPVDFLGITLGQYIAWYKSNSTIEQCAAALSCTTDEARKIKPSDMTVIVQAFDKVVNMQGATHRKVIKVQGTEYGFIPNIDLMTAGEFVDLDAYNEQQVSGNYDALLSMAAILYRPITRRLGNLYNITQYSVDTLEYQKSLEDLKHLPIADLLGGLVFFCNIENDLLNNTLRSLTDLMNELKMEVRN